MSRILTLGLVVFLTLIGIPGADPQESILPGDPIVIQIIPLVYADAEELVSVLAPFLSPAGRITAYAPTNSLIIKDRQSVVRELVKIIKGGSE
ncbi:MAG: hypothetical protein JSW39_17120 [Desulfobacterales bacterium]|nr:MAG: hypothetical protein JSW39_17120 [Desulfobacterales bacterium]